MSESWACQACSHTNAGYVTRCGACSTPFGATGVTEKFRIVIDVDVPEGHMGIEGQAVVEHFARLLQLHGTLLLEHHLFLKRDRLRCHGVRAVMPPRAAPGPGANQSDSSPLVSPSAPPVPTSPAGD